MPGTYAGNLLQLQMRQRSVPVSGVGISSGRTGSPLGTTTADSTVGAENLCDQAIFMNHAPEAVASLDPEMIDVGDGFG
jgi:hypothetical protein